MLTTPLWVVGATSGIQILPGLPIAALSAACPAVAAFILARREGGQDGGRSLLIRAFDGRRISPIWWLPILFLLPALSVAAFWILRLSGSDIPNPQFNLRSIVALSALFLVGALGEELGWSGFALEPLQARLGALGAGLLLGAIWAVWHYPPLLEAHRSWTWIAWWTLGTLSLRMIMVWIFNNTGSSVFGAAVFHAVSNLCWQLFPVQGSWFDPRIHGLLTGGVAVALGALAHGRGKTINGARFR